MIKYDLEMILTLYKASINLYMNACVESQNKDMINLTEKQLIDTLKLKEELYNKMSEDGFYTVSNVKPEEIDKVYKKLTGSN